MSGGDRDPAGMELRLTHPIHPSLSPFSFFCLSLDSPPSPSSCPSPFPFPSGSARSQKDFAPQGSARSSLLPASLGAAEGRAECSGLICAWRQARWAGFARKLLAYKQPAAEAKLSRKAPNGAPSVQRSRRDAPGAGAAALAEPGRCPSARPRAPPACHHRGRGHLVRQRLQQHGRARLLRQRLGQLELQHQPDGRKCCFAGGWRDGGDATTGVSPAPGTGGAGSRWRHLVWFPSSLRASVSAPQGGKPGLGLVVQEPQGFAPDLFSERLCPRVTALVPEQSPGYF